MDQDNHPGGRFAPPAARIDDPTPAAGELQPAGRGLRFLGMLLDGVIMMGAMWLVSLVTPWKPFALTGEEDFPTLLVNEALSFALFVAMQGWLMVKRGQTFAKYLLGMRVVRPDGRPVDAMRMLGLRHGLTFAVATVPVPHLVLLCLLVDALPILRAQRRCLHDLIADTVVVRA